MVEPIIAHGLMILMSLWFYLLEPVGSPQRGQYFQLILFWILMFKFQQLRHEIKLAKEPPKSP